MNPPKPETEIVFHTAFFLFMTFLGGFAVWHGEGGWAGFCFVAALASLALMFWAAGDVEKPDEDGQPPMGE